MPSFLQSKTDIDKDLFSALGVDEILRTQDDNN